MATFTKSTVFIKPYILDQQQLSICVFIICTFICMIPSVINAATAAGRKIVVLFYIIIVEFLGCTQL
jgi:hypothetical protein